MSGNAGQGQGKAMTSSDAARIQSANAKSGGDMSSGGFPARAQSGAANNANAGQTTGSNASNNSSGQGKK